LPEEERLRVLVNWLNLDFNEALKPRMQPYGQRQALEVEHTRPAERQQPQSGLVSVLSPSPEPATTAPRANHVSPDDEELLKLLMVLDTPQKRAMLELIKSGFRTPALPPR
jgi:hypothetical protein